MEMNNYLLFPVRKPILNLNYIAQIVRYAFLCFSCHTIPTVPVFFIALFQTSDPTAIIPGRRNAFSCCRNGVNSQESEYGDKSITLMCSVLSNQRKKRFAQVYRE
jgi:hypothetical protein